MDGHITLLDGHQPTQGWLPTNLRMVTQIRKCIADLEFCTYTLLTPGDNCHEWSPTLLRMVAH